MISATELSEKLTLDEKVALLAGANFWETVPIPRLKIPALKVSDGPNGARGAQFGSTSPTAACFPASVAIAATFDHTIAYRIGKALAEETRSKGASVLLAPTVCPHRSPRGGRNFESFSEDPLLAGNLATHLIQGLQENGVGATIKHYAANETETRRHFVNVNVDERTLREIYLKPFEIAIKAAKPWAVMTSYNLVNGVHADMSEFLLKKVLRDEWQFQGLVMSDWGGTNSVAASISAGLDLEMPGPPTRRKLSDVKEAIHRGELQVKAVENAAGKVLGLLIKAGKFEHPIIPPEQSIISADHSKLIREAGAQSIVLLKNERNLLPLSKEKLKRVAAVGLAKDCLAHGGGSAMVNCHYKVTPFEALGKLLAGSAEIEFAKGAQTLRNLPDFNEHIFDLDGRPGFTISAYDSTKFEEAPKSRKNIGSATYSNIGDPYPGVIFEAEFRPTVSGSHYVSVNGFGPTNLYIDDLLVLSVKGEPDVMGILLGGVKDEMCQYKFCSGQKYRIRLESSVPPKGSEEGVGAILDGVLASRLGFVYQHDYEKDHLHEAIEVARSADVVLAFVGNTSVWETEGRDQPSMGLPASGSQDRMITALAQVNSNIVVINSTGCPIAMPWLPEVPAVIQAWFGGQEAGNSIIDVLFGTVNPSGKLPVSFPRSEEEGPTYGNFPGDPENDELYYKEGIKIGYRYFDEFPSKAAFPFGFGLSYTNFVIGNAALRQTDDSFTVQVEVKNDGNFDGSEVVQVYVSSPVRTVPMAAKELVTYSKVTIAAGSSQTIELVVKSEKLAYWNVHESGWLLEKGDYLVLLGNSSAAVRHIGKFVVRTTERFGP